MTEQDQGGVIAHVRRLEENRYHREQVKIAVQRFQGLEDGLEEEVPYEEAMEVYFLKRAIADQLGVAKGTFHYLCGRATYQQNNYATGQSTSLTSK